jgi:hypothetical protein
MWLLADNLRIGAALNALEIPEFALKLSRRSRHVSCVSR